MNVRYRGFTLIELIVVIALLGILAAVAIPRFINVSTDARKAAVDGSVSALNSSVILAKAKYKATGDSTAMTIDMDGKTVTVNAGTGIPVGTAAGIGASLQSTSGYTIDYSAPTAVSFRPPGGSANCQAAYNGSTGIVTPTTSNCG